MRIMDALEIGKRLDRYLESSKMSEVKLALATNTHQSQVSRIRRGNFTRITDNVRTICEYAGINLDKVEIDVKLDPAANPDLMSAICWAWKDGSDKRAKALARVIRSLKELS